MTELRQFGDLRPTDFERVPVWAPCHDFDHDEPWYDDTDEETYRPWLGDLPVDPSDGMFLVRARFSLSDGKVFAGFATPAIAGDDAYLGTMQPRLAVEDRFFAFWGGLTGIAGDDKTAFYSALCRDRAHTFPIEFQCQTELASGVTIGTILGFYRSLNLNEAVVE